LDGIYLGIEKLSSAKHERKALLIVSDGGDNHSRYIGSQVRRIVQESDVEIFAVGTFDYTSTVQEEREGPELLDRITRMTGGMTFVLSDPNRLPAIAGAISKLLRDRYVLAYVPLNKPRDGKWHKIKIRLFPSKKLGGLTVRAKNGYYAR
jgi:Ca-activated chloride channel family protein